MNIEQKNTLFVVGLVMAVLLSVAVAAAWLVQRHVETRVDAELLRSHHAVVEAQQREFQQLLAHSTRLAEEPALLAGLLTEDAATIKSVLQQFERRSALNLLAVYSAADGPRRVAEADPSYLASTQLLTDPALRELVHVARRSGEAKWAHFVAVDSLMRLAVVPIRGRDKRMLGILVSGSLMTPEQLQSLFALTGSHVAVFREGRLLAVTGAMQTITPDALERLTAAATTQGLRLADKDYYARAYPILARPGRDAPVARLLIAIDSDVHWAPYKTLMRSALIVSLLILLLAALVGIWVSRRWLTIPLRGLVRLADAIGAGSVANPKSPVTVGYAGDDELGDLARAFVTMQKHLQEAQAEEVLTRQRFHDFAESTSDWLWESDEKGRFSFVSQHITNTLAMAPADLLGRSFPQVFGAESAADVMHRIRPPAGTPVRSFKDVEMWVTTKESVRLCMRLSGMPFFEGQTLRGFRGTARDITQLKNDEQRLVRLANRDHLTGLSNRRRFLEDLAREIAVSQRQGQSGALMLIDLDHFKLINDTAGHAAGDEVLVQIGGLLRRVARNIDLIARLSGDEFALAMINTNFDQAQKRADEILKHLSQLRPTYGGRFLNVSSSIGIVVFPEHGTRPAELLAKADTAMYAAKRDGRNRAHLYSEDDMAQQLMGSQLTWKERIHDGLEKDLFQLVYQPVAATRGDTRVRRYEVLVRLAASDGSMHTPGSFIPTAEQFGLIRDVDRVVVRKALRSLALIDQQSDEIALSINLSGLSVGDAVMLKLIESELARLTLDRRRVIFEITESAACQDINRANAFIARIQKLGCRIALDDFGVGFSSFSYLKHLRADIIKIDGSFIRDIEHTKEDQLFVKALVDVARGMGMQTTAEFVESEGSLDMVRKLGVDYVQGYFIGRPGPLPAALRARAKEKV